MNRREFFRTSAASGGALCLGHETATLAAAPEPGARLLRLDQNTTPASRRSKLPDLEPAHWLWYPSERCLQNTFVLFRLELNCPAPPRRATGWIAADSRYRLEVNQQRVQWGPAPADPRWPEADPIDLTAALRTGRNVIGATVLFYGQGDGTWPIGKPGFLFWMEIEHADGRTEKIVSDSSWRAYLARAWRPGQFKRWYLRALQEEFDARLYPYGWTAPDFTLSQDWRPAMVLPGSPNKPAISATYYEYMLDVGSSSGQTELRPRSIPLLRETLVPAHHLAESYWLEWLRPPREYFECRTPEAFRASAAPLATERDPGVWEVNLDGSRGAALTFEFSEQVVGWPYFTIDAPAGTVVELLVHEAHKIGGPPLLNTHFDSWTRFTCRAGVNQFETFDFESLRWLQLHIHSCTGTVRVREIGVRRRMFNWPQVPRIRCSEPALQKLFEASINTMHNCAQETCVDGMARERQQYSGDGGHQLHALYYAFGETRLPGRFLTTFSQGMTLDGFFLDCWPAYDRLARLIERQLQLTNWGPLLDHGVGFNFDCWHYYNYTADLEGLREPYPRLLRFAEYLHGLIDADGLLPVENIGIPSVWIDHGAYQKQRHKQCAFNLYAAAMLENALAPICHAFGETRNEGALREFGRGLNAAAVKRFWSEEKGLFVNNLPWQEEEKAPRICDRSLATAILYDQCPLGNITASVKTLVECPPEMGLSYPCNAGWRLWALAKAGHANVLVKDLRARWATMDSVRLNNTLQEDWNSAPDSGAQWSHCAVVPLYITYMSLAGIRPLEPGFRRVEIRPQLADLAELDLTAQTVRGPIAFAIKGAAGDRQLTVDLPPDTPGELVVAQGESLPLARVSSDASGRWARYGLEAGKRTTVRMRLS